MTNNVQKLTAQAAMAVTSLLTASAAEASMLNLDVFDMDFGQIRILPEETQDSTVALWAVSEQRQGENVEYCVLSAFKDGLSQVYSGQAYDAEIQSGAGSLQAVDNIQGSLRPRDTYLRDASYIIAADSNTHEDFVRINVGAPQVEQAAKIFIGDQEIPSDVVEYEHSKRFGHPDREAESYTLLIKDQGTVQSMKHALAAGETITVHSRSVNNDYIMADTYTGNMNLTVHADFCQDNLEDMSIPHGVSPNWRLSDLVDSTIEDILDLARRMEDEQAMANPEDFQQASILGAQGMFAIGPNVLQQMMDGEVVESSMGEYISQNHTSGQFTLSPDITEFTDNKWNSCSCRFTEVTIPPDTPGIFIPPVFPPPPVDVDLPNGGDITIINWDGPNTSYPPTHNNNIPPVGLPLSGGLLMGAIGILGLARRFNTGAGDPVDIKEHHEMYNAGPDNLENTMDY